MKWISLLKLLLLVLVLTQVICQGYDCRTDRVHLTPRDSDQCTSVKNICLGDEVTEVYVGSNHTFSKCSQSGTLTFSRRPDSENVETITNGGRFSIDGQTLTISNIQPEDDGEYRCSNGLSSTGLGCLVVIGSARFRTCDSDDLDVRYTTVPTIDNSCSQTLNVTEGDDVIFDTRLQFSEQGTCQCIEELTLFRVRRDSSNNDNTIVYFCDWLIDNCVSKSGFVVMRENEQLPYNFSLVLPSVNLSSSGRYYVEVERDAPQMPDKTYFWKIFDVVVNPAPPTEETPPTTQTGGTGNTGTSNDQSGGVEGIDSTSVVPVPDDVVVGVVVGVVLVVVVVVVLVIVAVVLVIAPRRTRLSDVADNCKSEPQYDIIAYGNSKSVKARVGNGSSSQHTGSVLYHSTEVPKLIGVLESSPISA